MTNESTCPRLPTCAMFVTFAGHESGRVFKKIYCEASFSDCERYRRIEKGQCIESTLLPNGTHIPAPR